MKNFGFEKAPGVVELNELECCALRQSFAKNPQTISQLMDFVDNKKLKLCADELVNSKGLGLRPDDDTKTAYSQIAKAELRRLEDENTEFKCAYGHSLEEHKQALQSVVSVFSKPVN
jgi:hypothetical protein